MVARNVEGRAAARDLLLADPARANAQVARLAGITPRLAKVVRAEPVCEGVIPARKITAASLPFIPDLPPMPDFSQGRCASHPSPGWWSSGDREEREAASWVCKGCRFCWRVPRGASRCHAPTPRSGEGAPPPIASGPGSSASRQPRARLRVPTWPHCAACRASTQPRSPASTATTSALASPTCA